MDKTSETEPSTIRAQVRQAFEAASACAAVGRILLAAFLFPRGASNEALRTWAGEWDHGIVTDSPKNTPD